MDDEAGPVVRPYAVTKGRTLPSGEASFGLIDLVAVASYDLPAGVRLSPEHRRLLGLCQRPSTVVDLASDVDLPVGVVRVLLGDLTQHGLVRVLGAPQGPVTDERLLREVLDGLQAL